MLKKAYQIVFILAAAISFQLFETSAQSTSVEVNAFGILKNGSKKEVVRLVIQEFLDVKFYSLLNYIFFDENSDEMPKRYILLDFEQTKSFNPGNLFLNWEILDVYWHILNITGYRLRKSNVETISLTGCNSNSGAESGNKELSLRRAARIKKYLTEVWKIQENRILINEPRNLPAEPSQSATHPDLAKEENMRVEISASWNILQPLVVTDTTRIPDPPAVLFSTSVISDEPVKNWKLTIEQAGTELRRPFIGTGNPDKEKYWFINRDRDKLPSGDKPVVYRLYINDSKYFSNYRTIKVEQLTISEKLKKRIKSREYSRYNLILFEFKKGILSDNNRKILKMIQDNEQNFSDSAKFFITGYTDIIGSKEANLKLSAERAEQTRKELVKSGITNTCIITSGLGYSSSPYYQSKVQNINSEEGDFAVPGQNASEPVESGLKVNDYNNFPEGRFYCRTVVIEIENPVIYRN